MRGELDVAGPEGLGLLSCELREHCWMMGPTIFRVKERLGRVVVEKAMHQAKMYEDLGETSRDG
jgi:hypothetical protein